MNRKLLTACFAVMSFAACKNEPRQGTSVAQLPAQPSREALAPNLVDAGPLLGEAEPDMEDEPDLLGLSHVDLGQVRHLERVAELKEQGDSEAALKEGRKALFDDPADEEALWLTAELARNAGEKHLAVLAYDRLSDIDERDAVPLVQQARILMELEDAEGAQKVASQALERDSENPEATHLLGRAELSLGNLGSAIDALEKTLELSPDHPHALNNLGFAYLRANRNEDAVSVLERAVELLPNLAYVHNNLGVAYERVGRESEARLAYEDALAASPKYLKARLNVERLDQQVAHLDAEVQDMILPDSEGSDQDALQPVP